MKILIIRFKQIGDAVLSSVICNTLKKSFPEAEIDYVVYEHIA
ncbi:glycosyltransferase family 9 protein, partial [Fusobacterium varium]|nr:lipopolysaccharide heptosyltransferase family protein [Fusobacterium varium]MCF2674540.1 lipopolysaccharide heptosyltransferase family protein [Fusobacterium varium]